MSSKLAFTLPPIKVRKTGGKATQPHRDRTKYSRKVKHRAVEA